MGKLIKTIVLAILGIGLLGIGVYLFFGNRIEFYIQNTEWYAGRSAAREDREILKIGYSLEPGDLNPVIFNMATRQFMVDIYEGLVKTDKDLNIQTGLAISWGVTRDNIWEFRLRPDVKFHNGLNMTADDVVYSLNMAKNSQESEFKNLLVSIVSVKALSNDKVQIETNGPDPLLLNKLALVFVVPDKFNDFSMPVGTGAYQIMGKRSNGVISLKRFDDYWGKKPVFKTVDLKIIEDRKERISALESGDIDILVNVPPNVACSLTDNYAKKQGCTALKSKNVQIKTVPSLEVSFIMFNMKNAILDSLKVREALVKVFDYDTFNDLAFGFTVNANQFISNGVFGYNPEIENVTYDLEAAKIETGAIIGGGFERPLIVFDYPVGLDPIGFYVRDQLLELGIDVSLNALTPESLESKIKSGKSDMYFFGWKSELGDSSDFLNSVAHTKDDKGRGLYNGLNYSNSKVDELLEKSGEVMDPAKRIKPLQDVMDIIVTQDVIGVPLFESEKIFAFKNNIVFEPRIDGYVIASEIY